jgi:hypothetical protein
VNFHIVIPCIQRIRQVILRHINLQHLLKWW